MQVGQFLQLQAAAAGQDAKLKIGERIKGGWLGSREGSGERRGYGVFTEEEKWGKGNRHLPQALAGSLLVWLFYVQEIIIT